MRFGLHVSIGSGWVKSLDTADMLGCGAMQAFSKNPRGWAAKPLDDADVAAFKEERDRKGISPLVIHASYLLNLASGKPDIRDKSQKAFMDELARCEALGADYFVFHPGAAAGWSREESLDTLANMLVRGLEATRGLGLLLENVAGSPAEIGGTFGELASLIDMAGGDERLGICLDTCHAHASGYDLATSRGLDSALADIDAALGLHRLALLHLNDAKGAAGSHLDRHAHIGEGAIGLDGMRRIVNHPRLSHLPAILETPRKEDGDDVKNLSRIRSLVNR